MRINTQGQNTYPTSEMKTILVSVSQNSQRQAITLINYSDTFFSLIGQMRSFAVAKEK